MAAFYYVSYDSSSCFSEAAAGTPLKTFSSCGVAASCNDLHVTIFSQSFPSSEARKEAKEEEATIAHYENKRMEFKE